MSNKKLWFVLLAIIVLTLSMIVYLILTIDKNMRDTIRFEILNNLLQLFVIMIIGGMVAYFFKSREEARKEENLRKNKELDAERNLNEIRIDYFNRLGEVYREVKSIRRILTAGGLSNKYNASLSKKQIEFYCEQMKLLNNNQLLLECLMIEAISIPAIVKLKDVETLLHKMEDYLRQILKEYETVKAKTNLNYSDLTILDKFINSSEYGFLENFSMPYKTIIKKIGKYFI
ncbi:MAG: otopetrin domain-containing protein [Treponema sp.]|nr:otopetrin domain-containing protein [Treponema sp.]